MTAGTELEQAQLEHSKTLPNLLAILGEVRFFSNLDIGPRLAIGFGILVLLTFLSAGFSYLGSRRAADKIQLTDDVRVPVALAAANAQANLLRMQADVRGYLALGDERYEMNYELSNAAFQGNLAELQGLLEAYHDKDNLLRLSLIQYHYGEWSAWTPQLFELRKDQLEREPAYKLLATDGIRLAGRVLIDVNSLIEAQGQRPPSAENTALLQDMAQFQGGFAAMLSALRGYVATRNTIFRDYEYEVNLVSNQLVWDRLQSKRHLLTDSQQGLLDNIANNRDAFLTLPASIFAILESDRYREDLYLFTSSAVPNADRMQELFREMTSDQQLRLTTELAAGRRDLNTTNQQILGGGVIALVAGLGLAFGLWTSIVGPVRRLTSVSERIRAGDLEAQAEIESTDEIGTLAETFNNMTGQLRTTLQQVRKEKTRADNLLEVVIPIGIELASEKDFNRLLEKMLLEAKTFCNADAGTLYLLNEKRELEFVLVRNDSRHLALGGATDTPVPYAPLPLDNESEELPDHHQTAIWVASSGRSANMVDYDTEESSSDAYRVNSILGIPLKNSQGDTLGVLELLNAQDPDTGSTIPFDENLQQMMESFSSLAVAALEAYIREQGLRKQIQQLRIEIDEAKKARQVAEITESDYFQTLRDRARTLRTSSTDNTSS